MASSYHFVYFDVRARGESIRLLFALAGADYTEDRIGSDKWPALKGSGRCPFGSLPVLELGDGKTLAQSNAVLRFLAKELDFSPTDNYECARADMIVDGIKDLQDKFAALIHEKDELRKAKLKSSLFDEVMPQQMKFLDKLLQANNGGKGYFVGDKITYADVLFFAFFNGYIAGGKLEVPDLLKSHPLLVDLYNRVMNEPKILEYLKKRKPSSFPY